MNSRQHGFPIQVHQTRSNKQPVRPGPKPKGRSGSDRGHRSSLLIDWWVYCLRVEVQSDERLGDSGPFPFMCGGLLKKSGQLKGSVFQSPENRGTLSRNQTHRALASAGSCLLDHSCRQVPGSYWFNWDCRHPKLHNHRTTSQWVLGSAASHCSACRFGLWAFDLWKMAACSSVNQAGFYSPTEHNWVLRHLRRVSSKIEPLVTLVGAC